MRTRRPKNGRLKRPEVYPAEKRSSDSSSQRRAARPRACAWAHPCLWRSRPLFAPSMQVCDAQQSLMKPTERLRVRVAAHDGACVLQGRHHAGGGRHGGRDVQLRGGDASLSASLPLARRHAGVERPARGAQSTAGQRRRQGGQQRGAGVVVRAAPATLTLSAELSGCGASPAALPPLAVARSSVAHGAAEWPPRALQLCSKACQRSCRQLTPSRATRTRSSVASGGLRMPAAAAVPERTPRGRRRRTERAACCKGAAQHHCCRNLALPPRRIEHRSRYRAAGNEARGEEAARCGHHRTTRHVSNAINARAAPRKCRTPRRRCARYAEAGVRVAGLRAAAQHCFRAAVSDRRSASARSASDAPPVASRRRSPRWTRSRTMTRRTAATTTTCRIWRTPLRVRRARHAPRASLLRLRARRWAATRRARPSPAFRAARRRG